MAGMLALQRVVIRTVGQRAKDGSLIDSGVGDGGGGLPYGHWPMLLFLSIFHPTAQPHPFHPFPPLIYFVLVYLVSTVRLSPQPLLNPPRCHAFRVFHYVALVCLRWQHFEERLCLPCLLLTFFIFKAAKMLSSFWMFDHIWCTKCMLLPNFIF